LTELFKKGGDSRQSVCEYITLYSLRDQLYTSICSAFLYRLRHFKNTQTLEAETATQQRVADNTALLVFVDCRYMS